MQKGSGQKSQDDPIKKASTARAGQRNKSIEEVVEYAISHRTRVLVLSLLNEGTFTPSQISEVLNIPVESLSHHIRELADAGSIELTDVKRVRNVEQHHYRAVEMPFYSDEEVREMPPLQRQISAGLIIQCLMAEVMAALWTHTIRDDPRCWLAWRWFHVDAQGRDDVADEQQRFWDRMQEIEAEACARRVESGEKSVAVIVAELGFERGRNQSIGRANA